MKLKNVSLANILLCWEVKQGRKTIVERKYLPAGGEIVEVEDSFTTPYLEFLIDEGKVIKVQENQKDGAKEKKAAE